MIYLFTFLDAKKAREQSPGAYYVGLGTLDDMVTYIEKHEDDVVIHSIPVNQVQQSRLLNADVGWLIRPVDPEADDPEDTEPPPNNAWIVHARAAKGWTQADLARESGVAGAMISRYETNKVRPRPVAELRLRKALGIVTSTGAHIPVPPMPPR